MDNDQKNLYEKEPVIACKSQLASYQVGETFEEDTNSHKTPYMS